MKNGLVYIKPEYDLIKEYEKTNTDISMLDMIPDNIPKKVKKPEFHVINSNKSADDHSNSSSFSYSSLSSFKYDDSKQITTLISSMKKENKIESRLSFSINLKNIESKVSLNKFVQLNGNHVIGHWIDDYKEEIESNSHVDNRVFEILTNVLEFCERLPVTVQDLKISKIGKKINKLGKCVSDRAIKTKCEVLVSRWKKMIENIKDKRNDKYDTNDKYKDGSDKYKEKDSSDKYKDKDSSDKYKDRDSSDKYKDSSDKYKDRDSSDKYKDSSDKYKDVSDKYKDNYEKSEKERRQDADYKPYRTISSEHNSQPYNIKKTQRDTNDELMDKNNKKSRIEDIKQTQSNTTSITQIAQNIATPVSNYNKQDEKMNNNFNNKNINISLKDSYVNSNNSINQSQNQLNLFQNSTQKKNIIQNVVAKKGILKKPDLMKKIEKRIKVKWESESRIEKVKIFKMIDEPEQPAITEEEYHKIQMEILKNPNYKYSTDMRSKEVNMEKDIMSKARERSKKVKDSLHHMVPQISWRRPYDLKPVNQIEISEGDFTHTNMKGSESEEKQIINSLCQKILSVTYFRDSEIPECPQMGGSMLFSFTDDAIPKIENLKKSYNAEKPNPNAEILEYINNYYEETPSPDFVKSLIQKLQSKEFSPEESSKISEYLNKHWNLNTSKKEEPVIQVKIPPMIPHQFPSAFNPLNMNNQFNFNSSVNMSSMPIINISPVDELHKTHFGKSPNFHSFNNDVKPLPTKYKTRPCRNFHGPVGCNRGDNCHFIHDTNFPGREIPDFNFQNYKNINTNEKKHLITNFNFVNNYGQPEKDQMLSGERENVDDNVPTDSEGSSVIGTVINNQVNYQKPMIGQGHTIPPNMIRPPFTMLNMGRPPYMNMNPQFMNQNPYMYMNFIRGQMPMPMPSTYNNAQNNQINKD